MDAQKPRKLAPPPDEPTGAFLARARAAAEALIAPDAGPAAVAAALGDRAEGGGPRYTVAAPAPCLRGASLSLRPGDARAPLDPVTGEKAPSFDIQVQDAAGAVTRNVETKRLRKPVGRVDDLTPGVKHAADKVTSATSGTREASISVALEPVEKLRAGRVRHMAPDGTWHIVEKDGSVRQRGSLMDKVAGHLPSIKNSHLLDRVNVVGPDGGVIGVFENQQGAWVRVQ